MTRGWCRKEGTSEVTGPVGRLEPTNRYHERAALRHAHCVTVGYLERDLTPIQKIKVTGRGDIVRYTLNQDCEMIVGCLRLWFLSA